MTTSEYNNSVNQYADAIYRFAIKHLKNRMSADDIVQETFAKVWTKHQDIEVQKVKSYLFTTAYHAIIDWLHKEKRNGDFNGIDISYTREKNFDVQDIINEALDRLPEIQKTVVILRDYEGYAYDEIGEITNLTESQVKVYIFRARQNLKEYIKKIEYVL